VVSASEALRFLHRAGELLGGSLDFEQTLRRVAQLAVPDIADWCAVYATSEDGPPQEVTSVHPDPEVEALIVEIRRRRRRGETGSETLEVMRSRRPVLATDIRQDLAPDVADDAERAVVARLGPRSYMIVPLIARGRVLGAMTLLSTREGRHYTEEDLHFAETIGAHFALVIDNARLYDAAEQSAGLLDTFFAIAPVGLGFVDNDLRYVRVNDAFAGFSDRPAAEHIGRTAREALEAELGERVAELHERVLESEEPLLDVELTDARRSWSASYTPVHGLDDQVIGLGIVLVDVTERRRLLEVERDARRRADFLARAGAILEESLVYEDTLGNVARIAVPDIADWCSVSILDRDGVLVEVARHHTDTAKLAIARELTERFPTPMNAPGGPPKVSRTGTTEFIPEITDEMLEAGIPDVEHRELVRALGLRSVIIAPLHARGRTFGTFTLAHAESGRRFDAADIQLAEEFAHRAGQAIENARLYTERARIAHLLQVKLLPERLPEIPGARVAARYRAAGELNEVGGDFYDVFARSPTEWALVVGDVSGKGAEAAAITALARYTLRAAALEAGPPSVALQRLNQAMLAHDDSSQFATVVLAYAAAGADGGMDVRLALGGHPPPLVLRADGAVEAPGAFGTILGATPDAVLTDVEVRLAAGDVLVLYTDGVTEAGVRTTPFGQEGLARLLQSLAGEAPEAVVGAVERAVVEAQPGEPRDDIAVVALSVAAQ
jgi:serine phosphatase RsbU (regulator of sigma subunit)/PAS domain-containing protein